MASMSAVSEVSGAALGDRRLNGRLESIVRALEAQPSAGFPKAMTTSKDTEAFYRFVRNEKVTFEKLLEPHAQATVKRAHDHADVLVVHDTTEFRFTGAAEREGLGRLTRSGHGFLGHFSLAVSADAERDPLGVVAVHTWARHEESISAKRKKRKISKAEALATPKESDRWLKNMRETELLLPRERVIHVADSEGDSYAILSTLVHDGIRFVIRSAHDRSVTSGEGTLTRLRQVFSDVEGTCVRTVKLSPRQRHPNGRRRYAIRKYREAKLQFKAATVTLMRPSHQSRDLFEQVRVNVVQVAELDAPKDAEPVEWLLHTTEPIGTPDEVLRIVDAYRARWLIEEFFKAIKTGCAYEKRQLESWHTLRNALAMLIPIAWGLLRMRSLSRNHPEAPADRIVTPIQLRILASLPATRGMPIESVRDVLFAVARLGGHMKQNGDPGWQVLGRGYEDLLKHEFGFRLALERSDQS